MKKLITCLMLAVSVLPSIAQVKKTAKTTLPIIKGICSPDYKKLYIMDMQDARQNIVDSVNVVKGAFTIKYNPAKKNNFYAVRAEDQYLQFIMDGKPLEINVNTMTLKGSPINEKLNKYDRAIDSINAPVEKLMTSYRQIANNESLTEEARQKGIDSLRTEIYAIRNKTLDYYVDIIKANKDNILPALYINYVLGGVENSELKEMLNPSYTYYNHPALAEAKRMLAIEEAKQKFVGQQFTDLTLNDVNGVAHKLSEYCGKGNYVLIDFWASWCGPCRGEMPNVKANFEKYHDKGFNIVAVSFDNKADAWKNAIAEMQMNWVNLSDLKAWNSEAGKVYSVNSIPANLLVDPQGKIIARDLREEALGNKLKEIYGF